MKSNSRVQWIAVLAAAVLASGCSCNGSPPSANQLPVVTLTSPAANAQFRAGESIALAATATDPEDGALDGAAAVWSSSVAGQLAIGANATAALSDVGEHLLTLTATDSQGGVGTASVPVKILAANAPSVAIVKPVTGASVNRNESIQFQCTATTVGGAPIPDANISWQSALSGALPSGSNVTASLTVAGDDTITCTATDPANGASNSASVAITVNPTQAPTVQITQPARAEIWVKLSGTGPFSPNVSFTATARDFNAAGGAGNLSAAISWTLTPGNTSLGTGATAAHTFSANGDYVVTASATDSQGQTATDSVTVHVVNNIPPQCTITRPGTDGQVIPLNTPYTLQGGCFDPEAQTPVAPTWNSSAQTAALGTGGNVNATFTVPGVQTLFACAVDPQDNTLKGCASRPIRVIQNTAPTNCTITAPAAGAVVNEGVPVTLSGSASDAEDPQNTLSYRWTSNVEGNIGAGATTTTVDLVTPGAQTITLTVTDVLGLSCTAQVNITVNAGPTIAITALSQGTTNCLNTSCAENVDVNATGTANDPQGIASHAWTDSFAGSFGAAATATLTAPTPGKHQILFSATDTAGARSTVSRALTILPAGRGSLASALSSTGVVEDLALATGEVLWVDGNNSQLRRTNDPAGTAGTPTNLPDPGLAVAYLSGTTPVTYIGTDGSGITRCAGTTCASYSNGPLQQSGNVVNAVAVYAPADLLVAGTDDGLAILKASDPSNGGTTTAAGKRILPGAQIRQIVISPASTSSSVKLYAATDRGLAVVTVAIATPFDPPGAATTESYRTSPDVPDDDVLSVAVSPEDKVFAGTAGGFSEVGQPGPALRDPPYSFPDEQVQALLFERRTINAASRDLLWAGTRNGLIRYDLAVKIPSRLTTTDGLPSNLILSLALGQNGVKYIGTSLGIGKYDGP